jgi:peroxiredoxin
MAKAIAEGAKAPAFTLEMDDGKRLSLKDLKGKKTVLYFYPKDDTPGCTKEAIAFSEDIAKFKRAGAVVIGVSKDSVAKSCWLPMKTAKSSKPSACGFKRRFTAANSWALNDRRS